MATEKVSKTSKNKKNKSKESALYFFYTHKTKKVKQQLNAEPNEDKPHLPRLNGAQRFVHG